MAENIVLKTTGRKQSNGPISIRLRCVAVTCPPADEYQLAKAAPMIYITSEAACKPVIIQYTKLALTPAGFVVWPERETLPYYRIY